MAKNENIKKYLILDDISVTSENGTVKQIKSNSIITEEQVGAFAIAELLGRKGLLIEVAE